MTEGCGFEEAGTPATGACFSDEGTAHPAFDPAPFPANKGDREKEKMPYFVVNEKCNGCLACVQNCPASALAHRDEGRRRILMHNMAACARCGTCWRICPQQAVEFQFMLENVWDEVAELDLVRCRVCKEPLYSTRFGARLEEKLDRSAEPLCPVHRRELSLLAKGHHYPGKAMPRKGEPI